MIDYTIYEIESGRIVRTGRSNADPSKKVEEGQGILYEKATRPDEQIVINRKIVGI